MSDIYFSKENLDGYLKELAKEYRRQNGKNIPAEVILIGGASILINYGFRETTYDMDAIIRATSSMKQAINNIGDRYGLPVGWLNDDFISTPSYTPQIIQFSQYYRTYANVVEFRTVSGEYLLAMKLKAGREYKHDRSDVIGILWEQENNGDPLTIERIKKAVSDLYGSYDAISDDMKHFIEKAIHTGEYESNYARIYQIESENRDILLEYSQSNPSIVTEDNASQIISALKKRLPSSSSLKEQRQTRADKAREPEKDPALAALKANAQQNTERARDEAKQYQQEQTQTKRKNR